MVSVLKPIHGGGVALKPIHAATGVINAGVGSAVFELNGTRVMCAIYGPQVDARQEFSERGRLTCEVKIAAFARPGRAATATAAVDEVALAEELHTALSPCVRLDAYPKCSWQLCAFVVEDDGSALAALINCGSLTLADASVQMFDTVAACSVVRRMHAPRCARFKRAIDPRLSTRAPVIALTFPPPRAPSPRALQACTDGGICVTPSFADEAAASGQLLVAKMARSGKVTSLQSSGLITAALFDDAYDAADAGCAEVANIMRAAMVTSSQQGSDRAEKMVTS